MVKFNKDSPERIGNGHYKVEGVEFMSVYTYKNIYRYGKDNNSGENAVVTMDMELKYGLYNAKCIMEVGFMKGEYVQLHSLEDLKDFLPKIKFVIGGK